MRTTRPLYAHAIPDDVLADVLELAAIEAKDHAARLDRIPAWHPRNEGDGGSGSGSDGGDAGASGGKDTAAKGDDGDAGAKGSGSDGDGKSGGDQGDDDGDDDDASAAAFARIRRENRELKAERAKAEEKAKREAGKFEELYNEEKAAREKLEADMATGKVATLIETAATKAKAVRPGQIAKLIDADALKDVDTAADAERIVKRLAKSDPHLFERPATRQVRDQGGKDDPDNAPKPRSGSRLKRGIANAVAAQRGDG